MYAGLTRDSTGFAGKDREQTRKFDAGHKAKPPVKPLAKKPLEPASAIAKARVKSAHTT